VRLGPLTLSQASFELNNQGFTFNDSWNFGVFTGSVSATIGSDSQGYVVTADALVTIFGANLELKGDIHADGNFDLEGKTKISVGRKGDIHAISPAAPTCV